MLISKNIFLLDSFWHLLADYQRAEGLESPSVAIEHLIARLLIAR